MSEMCLAKSTLIAKEKEKIHKIFHLRRNLLNYKPDS
jgi:hypothetical protein